ncbi:hypothetical protein [Bradyrhizobium sp. S3.7.6]
MTDLMTFAASGGPLSDADREKLEASDPIRFVWVRNRNAAGPGRDPMPQLIFEDVAVSHLEIVAEHVIDDRFTDNAGTIHLATLIAVFPAPEITP